MTLDALVRILRCPACGGALDLVRHPQPEPEAGDCGVLHCGCAASYPILDNIPILRSGALHRRSIGDDRILAPGPDIDELASRIEARDALSALVEILSAPLCPWPLNRVGALRRLSLRDPVRVAGLAVRRRRVRAMLRQRDWLTAEDWLAAFYLHAPEIYDPFNYFFFRFGTPRHLATLAFLSALPDDGGAILDVACGYGHVLHALTVGQGRPSVGLEQNAHQAWLAHHYVAPGAAAVVADANRLLPFTEGAFSTTHVSDAFQYFTNKPSVLLELERVADGGPVLIASTGNALHDLAESGDHTPAEYADLFNGRPWRVRAEADLLVRYLDGLRPDLSSSSTPETVAEARFLYYALDPSGKVLREHGRLEAPLHAAGSLMLNPLYEPTGSGFQLQPPSDWYEVENGALREYMPPSVEASEGITPALVATGAAVGLPERYARRARPWVHRTGRALAAALRR